EAPRARPTIGNVAAATAASGQRSPIVNSCIASRLADRAAARQAVRTLDRIEPARRPFRTLTMAKCWEKLHFDDKLNALSPITTSVQRLCGGESRRPEQSTLSGAPGNVREGAMGGRLIEAARSAYHYPLLIKQLLHAPMVQARDQQIVYRDLRRLTYAELRDRIGRLANSLKKLGVRPGDTVGVMDWDSNRFLEAFFAIPMMGAVLQTINV